MHQFLIGLFIGFVLYPVGQVLIKKLRQKAEEI